MEGEEERSEEEGSFSKASIPKRIAILLAGGIVNILFGLIVYFILASAITGSLYDGILSTGYFVNAIIESLKMLFTGSVGVDQLTSIVGISEIVVETTGLLDYIYMLALISLSLGVTNLLPFPPLDGGKILILLVEAVRRKPLRENTEVGIQMAGFLMLIALTVYVTYNDILRLF